MGQRGRGGQSPSEQERKLSVIHSAGSADSEVH